MGTQRLFKLCLCLALLLVAPPASTIAIDWTGWLIGGKEASAIPFWDSGQTEVFYGKSQAEVALTANLEKNDRIMEVMLDGQGNPTQLNISRLYTYSPTDFKIYKKEVPDYAEEQQKVGDWINQIAKDTPNDKHFISVADKFFRHLEPLAKGEPWLERLQQQLLATRLGISPQVFVEHPDFEQFVKANYIYKHASYHNHVVEVSADGMPSLLVEGVMIPWNKIKEIVQLDNQGRLKDYFYTFEGLVPGQPYTILRAFKKVDPGLYNNQHILEIVSIDTFPPHNWVRLIDSEGNLYSIGFWGNTPLTDLISAVKHLKPEEGRATSPDLMEIAGDPNKIVTTPIAITGEQFDKLLAYLEEYQKNPSKYQILSVAGENCATFVRHLTDLIGIKVKSSSWIRPFNNPYDVMAWQKNVASWRNKELAKIPDADKDKREQVKYSLPQ